MCKILAMPTRPNAQDPDRQASKFLSLILRHDPSAANVVLDSQGHSIPVDLGLVARTPPPTLFHGTAERFLKSILATGLHAADRQHVHLSADRATAVTVGRRHGSPVVLVVDAERLNADGQPFFLSDNNVWLTGPIAPGYITVDSD